MGNKWTKDYQATTKVKSLVLNSQFKRIVYLPENFDYNTKNLKWSNVNLKLDNGILCSFTDSELECTIKIDRKVQFTAEDAYLKEFLLSVKINSVDFIWRLKSETLVDFIQ